MMESTTETSSDESFIAKPKKKLHCPYSGCDSVFSKNRQLTNHVRRHTGERPHKCDEPNCNKAYTNSSHLRRHKSVSHAAIREKIECPVEGCFLRLSNGTNLKRHINRMHNSDRQYPFTCEECKQGFCKRRLLIQHGYLHTGIAPFNCEICNLKFRTTRDCNTHKRTHTSYSCECGTTFERWSVLLRHKKTCEKLKPICSRCQKSFKSQVILREHMLVHVDRAEREVFTCTYDNCDRYYFYKKNLMEHIKFYHKNIMKEFPCTYPGCKKILCRKQTLLKHLILHKTGQKKKKTPRKPRKDKNIPKKSIASILADLDLPNNADKSALEINKTDVDRKRKLFPNKEKETDESSEIASKKLKTNESNENQLSINIIVIDDETSRDSVAYSEVESIIE